MFPIISMAFSSSGPAVFDTQTVTTGEIGTSAAKDRQRGFSNGSVIGSISDGTSNIYSGAQVDDLRWDENGGSALYRLNIFGAVNSGWTTLTIGTLSLLRASATFSAGAWTWTTAHTVSSQVFGGAGSSRSCVFT